MIRKIKENKIRVHGEVWGRTPVSKRETRNNVTQFSNPHRAQISLRGTLSQVSSSSEYTYDFKHRKPYTDEMMELQFNYGLERLKAGRIDDMIFGANSTMGVKLPSEFWLRKWIEKVKYNEIPD